MLTLLNSSSTFSFQNQPVFKNFYEGSQREEKIKQNKIKLLFVVYQPKKLTWRLKKDISWREKILTVFFKTLRIVSL